jgi:glycosyltransferase involved in cell wall biosynthesis
MACFIRPGKRVEDFLKLADRFQQRSDVRFVLAGGAAAGDDSFFLQIRSEIEQCVSRGRIRWLGHFEPIHRFLEAIDIFVSTSEHESFGMSVCEAMAHGKAVAGYAACAVQEVVGDAGLIVETGDCDALIRAVEQLIDNSRLRQELGDKAKRRVAEHFDPAKSLRQLADIYGGIMRREQRQLAVQRA